MNSGEVGNLVQDYSNEGCVNEIAPILSNALGRDVKIGKGKVIMKASEMNSEDIPQNMVGEYTQC